MSVRAVAGEVLPVAEVHHEVHQFGRGSRCVQREIPSSLVTTADLFGALARLPRTPSSGPWPWRGNNKRAWPGSEGAKPPKRNRGAPVGRPRSIRSV
jgi:hypothetical protein